MKYSFIEFEAVQRRFIELLIPCNEHICREWHEGIGRLNLMSTPLDVHRMEKCISEYGVRVKFTNPINVMKWFSILSDGFFPIYTNIRDIGQISQSDKVDMLHDVYGHAPYLTNSAFNSACHSFSVAWKSCDNRHHDLLIKLWFYMIEFGVVCQDGNPVAFGGGLITSNYFLKKFIVRDIALEQGDIVEILQSNISASGSPERLFLFNSVESLLSSLINGVNYVKLN